MPNLFPGWVTSSATAITFTFGINEDLYRYIAVGLLVTIGLIVSPSPVVYQSIEKIEMVLVSVILICWKRGWRICNQEQFFLFNVIGLLSLIALSVLAFSTLGIQKNVTWELASIKEERCSQVHTYRVLANIRHPGPVDRQSHLSSVRSVAAGTKGVNGG